jgi:hypothetical protein
VKRPSEADGQDRPRFDIADIVRSHLPGLRATQPLSSEQARALKAITICRTAVLGGHANVCPDCGLEDLSYNSCRNRNCPKCQSLAQERWIATRAKAILPIPHFHGVFTLPEAFRALARLYPREIYNALFHSVSTALLQLARSRLRINLGLTLVLHTWTRELLFHPHMHVLISAGGLTSDGTGFKQVEEKFLLPLEPLAQLFKKQMMNALRKIRSKGLLPMADARVKMTDAKFNFLVATLANQDWNVYLKPAFLSSEFVLEYLGRYTHRVGISNSRLLNVTKDEVTFATKNGQTATLHPVIFLQRFVQHVLPDRFKKIRHAGLYASPKSLAKAQAHLAPKTRAEVAKKATDRPAPEGPLPEPTWEENLLELTGRDVTHCSACGAQVYRRIIPSEPPGSQEEAQQRVSDPIPRSPP